MSRMSRKMPKKMRFSYQGSKEYNKIMEKIQIDCETVNDMELVYSDNARSLQYNYNILYTSELFTTPYLFLTFT